MTQRLAGSYGMCKPPRHTRMHDLNQRQHAPALRHCHSALWQQRLEGVVWGGSAPGMLAQRCCGRLRGCALQRGAARRAGVPARRSRSLAESITSRLCDRWSKAKPRMTQ